jgi:hypothetical protein
MATSFVTKHLAPMIGPSQIFTPCIIVAPLPIKTSITISQLLYLPYLIIALGAMPPNALKGYVTIHSMVSPVHNKTYTSSNLTKLPYNFLS